MEELPILADQFFPFASEFYVVRRRFVLEKTVASVNFLFRDEMGDGTVDAYV